MKRILLEHLRQNMKRQYYFSHSIIIISITMRSSILFMFIFLCCVKNISQYYQSISQYYQSISNRKFSQYNFQNTYIYIYIKVCMHKYYYLIMDILKLQEIQSKISLFKVCWVGFFVILRYSQSNTNINIYIHIYMYFENCIQQTWIGTRHLLCQTIHDGVLKFTFNSLNTCSEDVVKMCLSTWYQQALKSFNR